MLEKIVNILKEVFWLKKSPKKRSKKTAKTVLKAPKKKITKKLAKKAVLPKKAIKKPQRPLKAPKFKKPSIDPGLNQVGKITHYFERIKVAVVKITQGTILIGDRLTIKTKTGSFVQKVWSMQIESQDVKVAKKGQLIGIKLDKQAGVGDIVYK